MGTLIAHVTTSGNTASAGINTTGATCLVCGLVWDQADTQPTITDSNSNVWLGLTARGPSTDTRFRLFYSVAPIVGAAHTFTATAVFTSQALAVGAFDTVSGVLPFDQENGSSNNSTASFPTGSITPTTDGQLIVAGLGIGANKTVAIDSSLTISDQLAFGGGHYGVALAYYYQPTAGAINPSWSWTGNTNATDAIASFKATSGGASTWGAQLSDQHNRIVQ